MNLVEVTEKNWEQYKAQMLNLETKVKNNMIKQGVGDMFFTTGEEIGDYAADPRHHVYAMIDEQNNLISQAYIIGAGSHIQGDYADLAKYFTMEENFLSYLKTVKYNNDDSKFKLIAKNVYKIKLYAFKYALEQIYGSVNIEKFVKDLEEAKNSRTHFDEATKLRRNIIKYMASKMNALNMQELYRQFYTIDSNFADYKDEQEIATAYDLYLNASKIVVYDKKVEKPEEYFEADVYNTIEVDTYLTDPDCGKKGAAKITTTVALNKTITEFFENSKSDVLYLSITLHKDNYLSENVASFLGFKDYFDIERVSNIERKAYMKRIDRATYKEYLNYLNKKLKYFYGYGDEEPTEEEKKYFDEEKVQHAREISQEISLRLDNNDITSPEAIKFVEMYREDIGVIGRK